MEKIKIFLSSSEELEKDRDAFGNIVRRLDKIYEKRGIRIELFEWEDYDAAYNGCPKQKEYNDQVRDSDMFLALFYKKAGKFTIEEFNVAQEEYQRNGKKPKSYVYCRDLPEGEQETEELKEFKKRLFDEMGHYWSRYNNNDSLQFHFVMQLLLVENNHMDHLKVEKGDIALDGTTVARMDNLRFAANNEDYQHMRERLLDLSSLLENARKRIRKYPDDEDLRDELKSLCQKQIVLQEEFEKQQALLFDTAKRIVQIKGKEITDRMRRAIDAFDKGKVREANIILSEAEHDAESARNDYRQSKIITEKKRKNFINSIKELWLKTSILMADVSIPISERIKRTYAIFIKADEMAQEACCEKEDYGRLLFDYATFLYNYAFYENALEIIQKQIDFASDKAKSYNVMGSIFFRLDMYQEALDVFNKAEKLLKDGGSSDDSLLAEIYNNIGRVFNRVGESDKAMKFANDALSTSDSEIKNPTSNAAKSFKNIAESLWSQGSCKRALENYKKALEIEKKIFDDSSTEVAISYRNIGEAYRGMSDYLKALEYYKKALLILEKNLGKRHPETALTYGCIGVAYMELHMYKEALDNTTKGLSIREEIFGNDNTNTAESYFWLGEIYSRKSEYQDHALSLENYKKALNIRKRRYGDSHYETLGVAYEIAILYIIQGKQKEAIEFFKKHLSTIETQNNIIPQNLVIAYNNLGLIYMNATKYYDAIACFEKSIAISITENPILGNVHTYLAYLYEITNDLSNSVKNYAKALSIWERVNGEKNSDVAWVYCHIGDIYNQINDNTHALDYYKIALNIQKHCVDTEDFGTAGIYLNIAQMYEMQEDYSEALIYYKKALEWVNEHKTNDISIAEIYNYIGVIYYNQGNFTLALENFMKAVEKHDELPDIATYCYNVGNTYNAQGDVERAMDYFLKALPIYEKTLGINSLDITPLYNDIGLLYYQMEKYSDALEYFERVLKIHEQTLDLNNPSTAIDYENIGASFFNLGDYSNAVCYYFKCLEKKEKIYGVMSTETANSYMNYGSACYYKGEKGTALEYFNKALNVFREKLGTTAPETQNAQEWIDAINATMEKEIILTSEDLVYEDMEIGSSSYSDGTLQYSSHAQMHWANSVYASPANDDIEGAIEIPSEITIEGKKHKVIGILSFKGCSKMTSIFLPKRIMEINGDGLFSGCDSLESIVVDKDNYFYESRDNCNAIIYKYDNANVLLAGCNNSTIPNGITKIREMAFEDCRNLTKITIPDSVRIIGRWAFSGCSSLKSIFIPDSVKEIGEGAFSFCSDIESIEVAKGNKIYDSRNGCNAIIETASNKLICGCKNTDIPDSVSAIGENAFSISSLHEIAIPESVTEIGGGAFAGDKSLKHIKMSSFILSIGDEAFSNSGLVSIDIPKSVTFINNSALYSCQKLERIRVDKENPVYDSRNDCNAIIETASNKLICGCKNTIIPESVTVIGEAAFAEYDEITSVVIPEGIVEIEPSAFRECKNLTSVYSHVKDPDACFVHISVFIEHGDNAVLYVPKGTVEAYRKAQGGWRLFRDIREFDSDK